LPFLMSPQQAIVLITVYAAVNQAVIMLGYWWVSCRIVSEGKDYRRPRRGPGHKPHCLHANLVNLRTHT
jgi:hypothetical protein